MFFLFLDPAKITSDLLQQSPNRHHVEEFVDIARKVDSTMSVGGLAVFIHVANRMPQLAAGDLSLRDIADEMQVPYTSFSRQLDVLAEGVLPTVRGLNLLEKGVHPDNRRQRQVRLTGEGKRLMSEFSAVFSSNFVRTHKSDSGVDPKTTSKLAKPPKMNKATRVRNPGIPES